MEVLKNSVTQADQAPVLFQMVVFNDMEGCSRDFMPDLPAEWSHHRDAILRSTVRREGLWATAVRRAISQATTRAWEVKGEQHETVRKFHQLFLAANTTGYTNKKTPWGKGWDYYLEQHLRSYTLTSNGAFTEVVWQGGKVIGFIHLDPSRCTRTGDMQIPVIYTDTHGRQHELAEHQVFMMADMTSESITENGLGLCAAERAYDEIRAYAAIQLKRYERVTGRSPDVIDLVGGVSNSQLKRIVERGEQKADEAQYVHHMGHLIAGINNDTPLSHVPIRVAGLPDDYNTMPDFEMAIYRYAAALDVDPQDIAPLNQGSFGSAGQSQTLDEKNKRSLLFGWDRKFTHLVANHLLDTATRFRFSEASDVARRDQEAKVLKTVTEAMGNLTESMTLSPEQARQLGIEYKALPSEFGDGDDTQMVTLTDVDTPDAAKPIKKAEPTKVDTGHDLKN